jgi:hypothetical protein
MALAAYPILRQRHCFSDSVRHDGAPLRNVADATGYTVTDVEASGGFHSTVLLGVLRGNRH